MFLARLQIARSGRRTLLIANCGSTGVLMRVGSGMVSLGLFRADREAALRVIAREKVCQT